MNLCGVSTHAIVSGPSSPSVAPECDRTAAVAVEACGNGTLRIRGGSVDDGGRRGNAQIIYHSQPMRRPARQTTPPMRLAIVCDRLEIGGQEIGLLALVRGLHSRACTVHVYAFRSGPLHATLRALGVSTTVEAPAARRADQWTAADAAAKTRFRRALPRLFRRDRIDVCLIYAWADGVAAAREAGVPAIVERVDGPKLVGWLRDKSSLQHIVCESDAIRRLVTAQADLFRCQEVPISVVRNGVDRSRFDPSRYDRRRSRQRLALGADEFVVGTIARLAPVKNLGHLLEAVRLLIDRVGPQVPVRVVIAGPDGGSRASLEAQVDALGLRERVRFLGARADVPELLRAFDVFVLPSIQEGVSFALLEAMAMGLPCVATQSDSIAETVGTGGYLVGPLDPLRTTLALRELIEHPGLARALARRGRAVAVRHDLARMVPAYDRVLRRAWRDGRRLPPFRRRIAVVPGHARPRGRGTAGSIDRLGDALGDTAIDAYILGVRGGDPRERAWPPARREWFAPTAEGAAARRAQLSWIRPDAVVTDCPRVVRQLRDLLPGEEIVLLLGTDAECADMTSALAAADRLVPLTADARRRLTREWRRWAWKGSPLPTRVDPVSALVAVLSTPRPRKETD